MAGFELPVWPGLDRSRELEEFRLASLRRSQERRQHLMSLIHEERDATEQAWQNVDRTWRHNEEMDN